MGLIARWRRNRAAKRYARCLAPVLGKAFGFSKFYTADQIERGVEDSGLDVNFIVFGFARYMIEEDFEARRHLMPVYLPYDEAREILERYKFIDREVEPLNNSSVSA